MEHKKLKQNIPTAVYRAPPEDQQILLQLVEAVNRNKPKANRASCWSCCADIQVYIYIYIVRCTVNRTLRPPTPARLAHTELQTGTRKQWP
jgi:hypothetical protein